jgi:hypothetical protein
VIKEKRQMVKLQKEIVKIKNSGMALLWLPNRERGLYSLTCSNS